jgi:eukaryotic-like serine/threonine-protein kinase
MALEVGTKLGPYELTAPLGSGGMGEVYRARDLRLHREVAIKILPASFSSDVQRLRRFEQEAQAAATLNHPNILAVYDVGTETNCPYIVSELLNGETLRERLRDTPLPIRKTIDYAAQIARGLAAAHEKGIVHRDLKPENIFITEDGRVKILDFGLAKLTRPETSSDGQLLTQGVDSDVGTVLGTVGYMSPEQVRGKPADARSDLFSLGAILYEMLSGKRAFKGESAIDTMSAIVKEEPPELTESNRNIPPALEAVARHCLEKNPSERFQSARDVAFDLEMVSAASSGSKVMLSQRSKRAWLLPAMLIVIAISLFTGAYFVGRRAVTPAQPEFQRLTFQHGAVRAARFAPDGQTVMYGAQWDTRPLQLFSTRIGSPDSRALGLDNAELAAISRSGEMAVLVNARVKAWFTTVGTLARMPLDGGAPREVVSGVTSADWAPNGSDLAILRGDTRGRKLEYPIGKLLYDSGQNWLSHVRISPKGDRIAVLEHVPSGDDGWVTLIDVGGKSTRITPQFGTVQGLAWTPDGNEIWFAGALTGAARALYAVSITGKMRLVLRGAGSFQLHDISPDGRVLVTQEAGTMGIKARAPGAKEEVDLSWFDWSVITSLSRDGKLLIFGESGEASGGNYGVYARKLDGSPAVRLANGDAGRISNDGNWVVVRNDVPRPHLELWPMGPGQARILDTANLTPGSGRLLPEGKQILFTGYEANRRPRTYLFDLDSNKFKALTPEGRSGSLVSPDGKYVVTSEESGTRWIYPISGGDPHPLREWTDQDVFAAWTKMPLPIVVMHRGSKPMQLFRLDPISGKRQLWREFLPTNAPGIIWYGVPDFSEDGNTYAYSYFRLLSDVYVIDGLR